MAKSAVNRVHRVEVAEVVKLTPSMNRVIFTGVGLAGFQTSGVGDEYLRVFLPPQGFDEPVLPEPTDDGYWVFPEGADTEVRTYTVREWDQQSQRLTIDFVAHEGGIAATWAMGVQPGHVVGVNTPRPLYAPRDGLEWQLLVADLTGLPAVLRLAEQAPAGVRTRIVIEVPSADDEQPVELPEGVELAWVHGGNGHGPSRLEEIVRSAELPKGIGYVWVAGEAKATRAVRKYLRHELKLPADAYKVVGYWTENAEAWLERYEALPDDLRDRLAAMWGDESRDVEEVTDEYEAALESHGL